MVRVRFAPSPTGYLHIGGARTCLFNWLYARNKNGKFILRIEDTDLVRSKKEYLEEILESIKWLGMDWDEIYYQSQRFEIYKEYAFKLVKEERAFQKEGAIFFKYNFTNIVINDIIRGEIVFTQLPKEEEVIIKKDGSPTYNFSCVIDDALLGITHVIRGEDHISNTPKQILMYKALGFKIPEFAHVPLILSEEGGRLSKRFGATSIREYKKEGYLQEAIFNYLLLLGWSPGKDQEIISKEEAIKIFDIKDINRTASAFSIDKLNWINSEYIKRKNDEVFVELVEEYLKEANLSISDKEYIKNVALLFKNRIHKLSDILEWGKFCFFDSYEYSEDTKEILIKNLSKEIKILKENLYKIEDFKKDIIEIEFRKTAQELGLKAKDLVHPVRVALTGKKVGPGLFETMEVLGKERVLNRLDRLINYWEVRNV